MVEQTGSFAKASWVARLTLTFTLVALGLAFVATAALVVEMMRSAQRGYYCEWEAAVFLVAVLVAEAALAGWAMLCYGAARKASMSEALREIVSGRLSRLETLTEDVSTSLRKLNELSSLSDQAKSMLFRTAEQEAIREAFHECLIRQDYAAAEVMVESVEKKLGSADEAGRLRKELASSRKNTQEEKVDAAVARVRATAGRHDWDRAMREAQLLVSLFPQNGKIIKLPHEVNQARVSYKRGLLEAYGETVRKNDLDHSIELLHQLDAYLTPQEAAALKESARGVFRAKLHNLGVQFAILVGDQQWAQALATGRQIVDEFPNSRMAQEVREKLDLLRTRADQGAT